MDKKVTRRVAIGSIIGGVVAAPFVYYFLKGRNAIQPPSRKLQKTWTHVVQSFEVPIKEIDGPKTFTLDYRPPIGVKFRLVSLFAGYNCPADYPELPFFHEFANCQVTAVKPIVAGRPAFLVHADKVTTQSNNKTNELPGGECVFVPGNDNESADYYEAGPGEPKKIPSEYMDNAYSSLLDGFAFIYPKGKILTKGMKWTIPLTPNYEVERPCVIAGFFDVAGRKTVKVTVDKYVDNKENQDRFNIWIQQEKDDKKRESLKEHLKSVIEEEQTDEYHLAYYIDMKTGLNVRYERRWTSHFPKAPKTDRTKIQISQILEN